MVLLALRAQPWAQGPLEPAFAQACVDQILMRSYVTVRLELAVSFRFCVKSANSALR